MATPDLIASIAVNTFCDHLPFYRQEQRLARISVSISRNDMANWIIQAAHAVRPVFERLLARSRESEIINMDRTSLTVMGEPGKANASKSYMWLMRAGPPDAPMITYHDRPSHRADEARSLLGGFSGFLQTDGLEVYPAAIAGSSITHVGCWAHARRKFHEALKAVPASETAKAGMAWIGQLYAVERDLRKRLTEGAIDRKTFLEERLSQVEPILDDFKRWLDTETLSVLPSSLAGKAISYTLGQWEKLIRYRAHADLTPDNNLAENAIRPFVLGRKNWLICGSPEGATASCVIYSLIETAKANGLNVFDFLVSLFHYAPFAKSDKDWDSLLPFKKSFELLPGHTINVPTGLY